MILDWRSRRYRGGSGWRSSGLAVVSVGVSLTVTVVIAEPTGLVIVPAENRTVSAFAQLRTVTVPAESRTVHVRQEPSY
jgi:hypothetical protein